MRLTLLAMLISAALTASAATADNAESDRHALTLYNTMRPGAVSPELFRRGNRGTVPGYAIVRHGRTIALEKGRNAIRFVGVAERIEPTTVTFESLTDPSGTGVLEQNFQFDLVGKGSLLQRYIDQPVTVEQARGQAVESFNGILLSAQGGLILREAGGGVRVVPDTAGVKLPSLPGGLITRPTLLWEVSARKAGPQRTRVSYKTGGMTWWTDYNLAYVEGKGANACKRDIGAWVSIVNQSGASYRDARLKLVAGDAFIAG